MLSVPAWGPCWDTTGPSGSSSEFRRWSQASEPATNPKALLEKIAKRMGIKRMLITSNKTRFTSVHASIESVLRLQPALQEVLREEPGCLTDKLVKYISDDMFFIMIKQLCKILEPFTLVIQAAQAACATLADGTRY